MLMSDMPILFSLRFGAAAIPISPYREATVDRSNETIPSSSKRLNEDGRLRHSQMRQEFAWPRRE
jgi:hypothetical protein